MVLRLDLGLQRLLHPPWALESASRMRYQVPSSSLWGVVSCKGASCHFARLHSESVFVGGRGTQWLERLTRDCRGFESLLDNFLFQGRLSALTLISVSVPPPCYHSST